MPRTKKQYDQVTRIAYVMNLLSEAILEGNRLWSFEPEWHRHAVARFDQLECVYDHIRDLRR